MNHAWNAISKYQTGTSKAARKAFNIEEFWNPVGCHGNLMWNIVSFSSSPVPELSFLPALHGGWTRAGEKRVQDNLHAHAQNEPIKNCYVPTILRCSCQCVTQCLFQLRLWIKTIFFDVDIVVENKSKYRGLYSYRQRVCVITLFPNIFSYCFCMLSGEFAKVFERKVYRVSSHIGSCYSALVSR